VEKLFLLTTFSRSVCQELFLPEKLLAHAYTLNLK